VVEDPATGVIYVSNINGAVMQKDGNGFISRLTADGKMLERQWVKGLNSPTGLALHDRTLYAADVDQLIEINAASGEILKRYDAKGAVFLNDVVVDDEGAVYVSDTPMNTIWRLKDGSFEPWLANDALNGPNGLLVQGNTLIVASLGKIQSQGQKKELGTLLAVSLDDQKVSKIGKGEVIGNLDGLQAIQPGVYLVTDWAQGALYRVDAKGKVDELIDLNQGSADLSYLPGKKMLLIPMMLDNSLVAYRLD
jgi:sugar lactone lactonase YvrE